ncbi:uncharacterized protein TNCV_4504921 [Trichonephila clavipes]|nr:uncharacterized protein TNCV_4504921 [Trichonephila clavipes]
MDSSHIFLKRTVILTISSQISNFPGVCVFVRNGIKYCNSLPLLFDNTLAGVFVLQTEDLVQLPSGNYLDEPSDQEVEFLRLLLSRYEADSPNYANPNELYGDENSLLSNYEFPLDQEDAGNPIPPSQQPVQEFSEDKVTTETTKETNMVTTPSTTTTDGLASVPPASREKGQKEYAMLRPPVDNHKKIEHWMKLMNENKLALDRNRQHYRQPRPGRPQKEENEQLQELLDNNPTQQQLAKALNVLQETISRRLQAMGKINKLREGVPLDLKERQTENRKVPCEMLLQHHGRKSFLY